MADVNANTEIQFVEYERFCKDCIHYKEPEHSDACNECLTEPVNYNSIKPTMFKRANGKEATKNEFR